MSWDLFDEDAEDRAERRAMEAEIATVERQALDAIRQISTLVERHGEPAHRVGSASLTHIAIIAQQQGQALFKRSLSREQKRRKRA